MAKRGKTKRGKARARSGGTIRKAEIAKVLRAIATIKDRATSRPIEKAAALGKRHRARNRALRRKVGPLLVSRAEIRKAAEPIAQYNKESAALFRKETAAARKSFLAASRKGPRAPIVSPLEAAIGPKLTGFGNRSAYYLLQPIATIARPGGMLWDTQVGGATGLAKIYFSADRGSGELNLEFWYWWENSATHEVRVNVSCPVAFTGVCRTHADIGLFYGGDSSIFIETWLDIYEWWKPGHPQAANSITADTRQVVLDMGTETGGFWDDNVQVVRPLSQYQRLRYGSLAVPAGGRVVTRVKVRPIYSIWGTGGFGGGGYISIDFASERTYAIIPSMTLEVINPAPTLDPSP